MNGPRSAFADALHSTSFMGVSSNTLSFILGADQNGNAIVNDFSSLSHLLIAGATGTGKSTLAHAILLSLIEKTEPKNFKILLCDTKVVEFSGYREVPHLLAPVASDPAKINGFLMWSHTELSHRLHLINNAGCRSIDTYNEHYLEQSELKLPHILLVIDDVVEAIRDNDAWNNLRQLAQNGRAAGIHLLLITQTPGDKKLTDIIRSSIPARAVFNIFSNTEEKMLLGAAKNTFLSDVGEIIFCVMPAKSKEKICCYPITDSDISAVISKVKERHIAFSCSAQIVQDLNKPQITNKPIIRERSYPEIEPDGDEMLPQAVDVVLETGQASVSILQRRLKLGYARAARIVDEMEEKGIVGPFQGSIPRAILITKAQWEKTKSDANPSINFTEASSESPPVTCIAGEELCVSPNAPESSAALAADGPGPVPDLAEPVANYVDQTENIHPSKTYSPSPLLNYQPKCAARKPAPAANRHMNNIERIVFFCGCLLLIGCFLAGSESLSDRVGMFLCGIGACVFAKVRSIRWITISIIFGLTGFTGLLGSWSNGQFDSPHFLTLCLCFGISIYYGYKAVQNRQQICLWNPSITLRNVDVMSGTQFEEFAAQLLKKLGYINVIVTQASGDQGIDVLAEKDGVRYAIQCKNYSHKLGNTPVQEAFAGKVFYGCDIAVVLTNSTFTDGAFELAASTGVQLWDRGTLCDMIQHANL